MFLQYSCYTIRCIEQHHLENKFVTLTIVLMLLWIVKKNTAVLQMCPGLALNSYFGCTKNGRNLCMDHRSLLKYEIKLGCKKYMFYVHWSKTIFWSKKNKIFGKFVQISTDPKTRKPIKTKFHFYGNTVIYTFKCCLCLPGERTSVVW